PSLQSYDRCTVFSCAAPPDETRFHQAAHHRYTEESVACQVCVVARGRIPAWPFRRNPWFTCRRSGRQREANHLLLGQDLLRSAELSDAAQDRRCCDRSHRATLSPGGKKAARNAQAISKKREVRLVP